MNRLGIHTGADLKAQSLEFLQQYFGSSGTYYHAIARGHDERRVVPDRPRKSVGSETTFMEDLGRPQEIVDGVLSVLDDVWSYCERTGMAGRTVTVKVKYADFQIITRSRTLRLRSTAGPSWSRPASSWCGRSFRWRSGCGCWACRCRTWDPGRMRRRRNRNSHLVYEANTFGWIERPQLGVVQ